MDQGVVDAVLEDWRSAPISPRLRAGLRLLEAATVHPADIDRGFVDSLTAAGLSVEELEEAANIGFFFNFMNRVSDAFDFDIPTDDQRRRQAKMLQVMRFVAGGETPSPSWTVGADGLRRPVELNLTREHFLTARGDTHPELRRAVEARAAQAWGATRSGDGEPGGRFPEELCEYVDRLALHAYRITDELVEALQTGGYSVDEIYEVTIAGALGAAFAGVERLFEALHGDAGRAG